MSALSEQLVAAEQNVERCRQAYAGAQTALVDAAAAAEAARIRYDESGEERHIGEASKAALRKERHERLTSAAKAALDEAEATLANVRAASLRVVGDAARERALNWRTHLAPIAAKLEALDRELADCADEIADIVVAAQRSWDEAESVEGALGGLNLSRPGDRVSLHQAIYFLRRQITKSRAAEGREVPEHMMCSVSEPAWIAGAEHTLWHAEEAAERAP